MANKSKAKGTRAESRVVNYLLSHGILAKRKALHGNKDLGDIDVIMPDGGEIILEVKTGKMTANYNRTQFEEWIRQTEDEIYNADLPGALVIVRYRRSIDDAEVWWPSNSEYHQYGMQYLDDFAKELGSVCDESLLDEMFSEELEGEDA